jgi:hypothetical protein
LAFAFPTHVHQLFQLGSIFPLLSGRHLTPIPSTNLFFPQLEASPDGAN